MERADSMRHEQPQIQPLFPQPDCHFREASLFQAFDQQQERLVATLEQELNKRLPLLDNIGPISVGAPRQVALPFAVVNRSCILICAFIAKRLQGLLRLVPNH